MTRTENPLARFLIYIALALFTVYNILPFAWTIMSSIKLPKDANARIPRFTFSPTGENYAELWLNMRPEDFAPYGLALVVFIFLLGVVGFSANRIPAPNSLIYMGCILAGVLVAVALPEVVNTAEFYDYLINSVIVTIGTLCVSLTIGALAGYGLARFRHVVSVYILVIALAFRSLPSLALVLPFYYLGQLSGLYDTHILLIFCLVAVNQPFTIWMLRSFFMEIPIEIEEAAMIDGAGRLRSFISVIVPIMWPGIITTGLFTLLLAYNDFLLARILTQINWTLPVGIAQWTGGEDPGHVTLAAAASVSTTLPILVVIIFFQKYLIRGLASGAVKG
ncbi:MAG: carbohydrate ABC transporter permease [Chloroflexota bacterium]|nr:carbohydrate ABC transporter permease [Chloroflexota bacterium]MDE2946184.1 carbohydrate ABC transporter permease [Chloroflexota bacterium]